MGYSLTLKIKEVFVLSFPEGEQPRDDSSRVKHVSRDGRVRISLIVDLDEFRALPRNLKEGIAEMSGVYALTIASIAENAHVLGHAGIPVSNYLSRINHSLEQILLELASDIHRGQHIAEDSH